MQNLSKKEWIGVVAGIAFVVYIMFGQSIAGLFNRGAGGTASVADSDLGRFMGNTETMDSQVQKEDLLVGSGIEIAPGMAVSVHYMLKLSDGTIIQDSKEVSGGQPFTFVYGAGQLIPGWEMGIEGMHVGGTRIITIPPELGYGAQAVGPIPANSTLVFQIEVVAAEPVEQ